MILVTGASGFIGSVLCTRLLQEGVRFRPVVRKRVSRSGSVSIGEIGPDTDWQKALAGVDTVIHLAAKVHAVLAEGHHSEGEYHKVNTLGTLCLARQAASKGIRRFIFLSTIKVNGESTQPDFPFVESVEKAPSDPYAFSKYQAEQGLFKIARDTGMEVVIIRPPLVYGPGVKANFLRMMTWLQKGIPLPFGAIKNRRSLLFVENLVDLIMRCLEHPAASNKIFLASDGEDLSITELLRRLADKLGAPARLIPIPHAVVETCLKLAGRGDLALRLCGSLQIDISKARRELEWQPPISVDEGLDRTARWFIDSR